MAKRDDFEDEGFLESLMKRNAEHIPVPPSMSRLLIGVAGLAVVATVVAVAWATWPSGKGRVDENALPVLKAEDKAYKIKPDDPGGMVVPNKDSTIFETLNVAEKKKPVENLLDEPETPVKKDDVFGADTTDNAAEKSAETADANDGQEDGPDSVDLANHKGAADADADDADTDAATADEPADEPEVAAAPAPVKPAETAPAVAATKAEPKMEAKMEAKTEPKKPVTETKPAVKADDKPQAKPASGSAFIQLAAVKSEADAKQKWAKLQSQYSALSGFALRVQKADLGAKGVFYRVQAGPASAADAQAACAKIKSQKGDCLLVK